VRLYFALALVALGCMSNSSSVDSSIDLSENGIPVKVNVPDDVEIKPGIGNGMVFYGVTTIAWIITKESFSLEVTMEDADNSQYLNYYDSLTKKIIEDKHFKEYIVDEDQGFIYKYREDRKDRYGFYYVIEKNKRAIEFSESLYADGTSLENIRLIYTAAKTAK